MKTILERLQVNESVENFDVKTFIEQFKALFCWDKLEHVQKEILRDWFRENGNVYDQLNLWWEQSYETHTKESEEFGKEMYKSRKICDKIYNQLDNDVW